MIDLAKELSETFHERSRSSGVLEVEFRPSLKLSYFVGHFPQLPILPAVAIIDISQFFVGHLLRDENTLLSKMTNFRIKTPVQPGDQILIRVQQEAPLVFHVLWKSATDEKVFAELSLQVSLRANP